MLEHYKPESFRSEWKFSRSPPPPRAFGLTSFGHIWLPCCLISFRRVELKSSSDNHLRIWRHKRLHLHKVVGNFCTMRLQKFQFQSHSNERVTLRYTAKSPQCLSSPWETWLNFKRGLNQGDHIWSPKHFLHEKFQFSGWGKGKSRWSDVKSKFFYKFSIRSFNGEGDKLKYSNLK